MPSGSRSSTYTHSYRPSSRHLHSPCVYISCLQDKGSQLYHTELNPPVNMILYVDIWDSWALSFQRSLQCNYFFMRSTFSVWALGKGLMKRGKYVPIQGQCCSCCSRSLSKKAVTQQNAQKNLRFFTCWFTDFKAHVFADSSRDAYSSRLMQFNCYTYQCEDHCTRLNHYHRYFGR